MRVAIAAVLCFAIATSYAQSIDSARHHYDSLWQTRTQSIDSSTVRVNQRIDSIQTKLNALANPDLRKWFTKKRLQKPVPDSLEAVHELDSIKRGVTHKIDSLEKLQSPTHKLNAQLDSLNQIGPDRYIAMAQNRQRELEQKIGQPIASTNQKINSSIDQVESKIKQPISKVQNGLNEKLNTLRQEGGTGANIPGNLDINTPSIGNASLPANVNTGNLNVGSNFPTSDKLNLPDVNNPLNGQTPNLTELQQKTQDLTKVGQDKINELKSTEQLQLAKDKMGQLNQVTDKVQGYGDDVKKVAEGNIGEVKSIPDAVESKVSKLDEIQDLQKHQGLGDMQQVKDLADRANNPEALKEQAQQMVIQEAKDHFAGNMAALQAAMDKMSKLKQKYSEVSSIKDLPKRVPNAMKGKPFIERLVPGITLQIQKMPNVDIDFNPMLSYRLTGRWTVGGGWNERVGFAKWNRTIANDRVFGPRAGGSFSFKKGFSVKAEVEKMNAVVPTSALGGDGSRHWLWSAFVGFKREYTFVGTVRGNVQVLYNIYDDHNNSPYSERLNVRMGFEFPMKRKPKPAPAPSSGM